MHPWQQRFLDLAVRYGVLKFGDYVLKSGRRSPYFFNVGEVGDGEGLAALGECYAQAVEYHQLAPDCLFGPAYKGIPIAVATGIALHDMGRVCQVAFNRKEVKDHGEQGLFVGGSLAGRVVAVDDVITSGAAIRQLMAALRQVDVTLTAVLVAMDRQERGADSPLSAVQQLAREASVEVHSVVNLGHIESWLAAAGDQATLARVRDYRAEYGVSADP